MAEAVALGPTGWPFVWCSLGSFVQPHPVPTHCSGEYVAQAPVVGRLLLSWLVQLRLKQVPFTAQGALSSVGDFSRAGLKPEAFPYTGETGQACMRMREWIQDQSLLASLQGLGSPVFPRASGECQAA